MAVITAMPRRALVGLLRIALVQTPQQAVAVVFLRLPVADGLQALEGGMLKIGLFEGGTTEFPILNGTLHEPVAINAAGSRRNSTAIACCQDSPQCPFLLELHWGVNRTGVS